MSEAAGLVLIIAALWAFGVFVVYGVMSGAPARLRLASTIVIPPAAVGVGAILVFSLMSIAHAQENSPERAAAVAAAEQLAPHQGAGALDPVFKMSAEAAMAKVKDLPTTPSVQSVIDDGKAQADQGAAKFAEFAQALGASADVSRTRGLKEFGDDDLAKFGTVLESNQGSGQGAVYVAVSFGMPKPALRQLARDAHKAGVLVVVRGLVGNSFLETRKQLVEVFQKGDLVGISIDPKVFSAYRIERTPTFIAAAGPVRACPSLDCVPTPPAADLVSGNISLAAALKELVAAGGPGSMEAQRALLRLDAS